jgi:hypothetical protein
MLFEPMNQNEYSGSAVLTDWYNYDSQTHSLSSKEEVYMIQIEADKYTKFQILNYYNEDNVSGHFTIKYENKLAAEY